MFSAPDQGRRLIDFDQKSLLISALSIAFNPIFWNTIARQGSPNRTILFSRNGLLISLPFLPEYYNKILTRFFDGNSRLGCYALAVTIFSLGIFRDML
ncbi:Phosphatidyl-N-methylethanolamine N-methyltransferase, partial [Xylographa vitiligo]|nr:Phosphatidyl-N-methylethanolamine N-methyltransferase [Xylographa vitiligo]